MFAIFILGTCEIYSTSLSNYLTSTNRHCHHLAVQCLLSNTYTDCSSHYDHLDVNTIATLGPNISYFVPLGNKAWFKSNFSKYNNVNELDWWEEYKWKHPSDEKKQLTVACTPCQHFSGRGLFDRNDTLWSSWTVL